MREGCGVREVGGGRVHEVVIRSRKRENSTCSAEVSRLMASSG